MEISISPELILARERRRKQTGIFIFLALAVVVVTFVLLINPATTQEYEPTCGLEAHIHGPDCFETVDRLICETKEQPGHVHDDSCYKVVQTCVCGLEDDEAHEHSPECFVEERILVCELPENEVHEHTADCIEWRDVLICGLEDDPEHEHSEDCWQSVPVFVCEEREGVGHVHNEFCYLQEEVLTCTLPEHEHTDDCYPRLTGDPHADVEIDFDWESTFCNVEKTGVWAEDLIAIASSQIGYAESARNFVTDEYNVQHGYTRYGDWYGNRYAGWNAIFVMFCLHYADVWGIPTDSVPANWMNSARAQGFWTEADGEPIRGDLVFFDDDADGFADRIAIVTEVREDEIDILIGGTGTAVQVITCARDSERIAGYLALPENPEYEPEMPEEELPAEGAFDTVKAPEDLEEELPAEGAFDTVKAPEDPEGTPEEIPEPEVPLAPPTDILLTAQTPDGITAVLEAPASSFAYPAAELELSVREIIPEAEEDGEAYGTAMDVIYTLSTAEDPEAELGAVRLFDISIWRREIVSPEPVEIPEPAEAVEQTEEPVEVEQAEPAADEIPEGTEADPELISEPEAAAEEILPEAEPEIRLIEILPIGPVRVTVEGLEEVGEDESVRVWHITEDGDAEVLTPESFGHGIVSVTTEKF